MIRIGLTVAAVVSLSVAAACRGSRRGVADATAGPPAAPPGAAAVTNAGADAGPPPAAADPVGPVPRDAPYPLPHDARSYTKALKSGMVTFQTGLDLQAIADFYRRAFAGRGFVEMSHMTVMEEAAIRLVFHGPSGGPGISVLATDLAFASPMDKRTVVIAPLDETVIRAYAAALPDAPAVEFWVSRIPFLVDVDGDGAADVVGRVESREDDVSRTAFAAFDATSGRETWRGADIDLALARVEGVALSSTTLLLADSHGVVHGVDVRSGRPSWTARLDEVAERFCGGGEESVVIVTRDDRGHRVGLDDGAHEEVPVPRACERLWQDTRDGVPDVERTSEGRNPFRRRGRPPAIDGMVVDEVVRRLPDGMPIALGRSAGPGTPVIMAAAFEPAGEGHRVLWQAEIPVVDRLEVRMGPFFTESAPVGLTGRHLVVPYEVEGDRWRLACFDAAEGVRRWDVLLSSGRFGPRGVVASEERLFVSTPSRLLALDTATGDIAYVIGFPPLAPDDGGREPRAASRDDEEARDAGAPPTE